jgi:octaprenyl-diphosphate synthase
MQATMNHKNKIDIENILKKEVQFTEQKLSLPKNLLSFVSEGKRIRAQLIHSSIKDRSKSLKNSLASMIELTHASSLIHDDIIDESILRRGNPTAYKILPIAKASSIGYFIFSRIFLHMIRLKPFIYKNYFRILSEMCIGQIMEIESMHQKNRSIQKYLQTIRLKTGSLFAFCFGIKENKWNSKDSSLGYKFGIAFQILDDLYDVSIDKNALGKPSWQDAKRGIYTLPFIYCKPNSRKQITNKEICATKNKALAFLKNVNHANLPLAWQIQFSELENRIKMVSCNISPESRDNNKNFQLLNQI